MNASKHHTADTATTIELQYRPPYRFAALLEFFRMRALAGVELVDNVSYARTVRIALPNRNAPSHDAYATGWLRVENNAQKNCLVLTISETLRPVFPQVIERIRRQFDLESNPQTIHDSIASLREMVPHATVLGTRVPGCFEPFETACRAVLGQQISVAAANKLAARIVEHYGAPINTGIEGLCAAFPSADEVLALSDIEKAFGELGVIKTRSHVIEHIAHLVVEGKLDFAASTETDICAQMETLLAIKGVGPWTANYIAMRALSYPDAFLETDAGVKHALPGRTPREIAKLAKGWRPWRSYANICLWNSLSAKNDE